MLKDRFIIVLLLLPFMIIGQNQARIAIKGEITIDDNMPKEDIHVYNITSNKGTITNDKGIFNITVQEGDTLLISGITLKHEKIIITTKDITEKYLVVPLKKQIYRLHEVVVKPYNLTGNLLYDVQHSNDQNILSAKDIGLPNANVHIMSNYERKQYNLSNHGDPIFFLLNTLTGRTKKNKIISQYLKKNHLLENVKEAYKDSLFINSLGLQKHQIDGFLYYCETDSSFYDIINSKDKLVLWEFLIRKSVDYKSL